MNMKMRIGRLTAIAGSVLLCLGIPALGQQDVTIDFTGVLHTSVQALGAYAGYYTGTVTADGVTTASSPGFICDDYNNEIFLPSESWQATAISFSSLATSTTALDSTLFGNTIGISGYAAIAYLSSLMASTPASGQADISAAIWYIGTLGGSDPLSFSSLDATAKGYVTSLIGATGEYGALDSSTAAALAELEDSTLWIYTPTGSDIVPTGDPYPQEFIGSVAVPEGGAALLYLLLAALSCSGALFLRHRDLPTIAKQAI